jgi:hypothetical protein
MVMAASQAEFNEIQRMIKLTNTNVVISKVERIINISAWEYFDFEMKRCQRKGLSKTQCCKFLFHGTRGTDPVNIIKHEMGFDMRYSAEGLWGRGAYFAVNA